jgi:hypothetical protein
MVSIYYQNMGAWIHNRRQTYGFAHDLSGGLSIRNENRVDLTEIPDRLDEVAMNQARELAKFAERLIKVKPEISDGELLEALKETGAPLSVVQKALKIARRKPPK